MFLAILLSLAVLVGWQYFFPLDQPPPQEPPAAASPSAPGATPGPAVPSPTPGTASSAPGTAAEAPAGTPSPPTPPITAAKEERVVVDTERFRAEFSNRGAQLVSFVLKELRKGSVGRDLELVRGRRDLAYPFGLVGDGLAPHPLNAALFAIEERSANGVTFRYNGPEGSASKRFRFDANGLFRAEIGVTAGAPGWRVLLGPGVRNLTSEETGSQYLKRRAIYLTADDVETLDPVKAEETVPLPAAVRWVGLEDNYYLAAVIPDRGFAGATAVPLLVEEAPQGTRFTPVPPEDAITREQGKLPREYALLLAPAGPELTVTSYWGAKEYDRLRSLPFDLQQSVDLGIFGLLALPLLAGLHWIHDNLVANYGWAIILMTILIKIVLLPLTHRSYVSMQKMQQLNPKMQSIRDRYKGKMRDKQGRPNLEAQRKMNEEIMGLYRSEGVNPAGGCLPMLLQLPILFAFYNLLTAAVELRHAPWIFWIHDLSTKDPFYVLPVVMAGTQFIQTKMTPMAGDPMQRRIFQLMPIFMLVFFLPSPSGLVLYWLTNNVLTILQQWVYNHLKRRQADR
jgi:YidC/Oxa1 family membrane protein insertase